MLTDLIRLARCDPITLVLSPPRTWDMITSDVQVCTRVLSVLRRVRRTVADGGRERGRGVAGFLCSGSRCCCCSRDATGGLCNIRRRDRGQAV